MGVLTVAMVEERLAGLKVEYQRMLDGAQALHGAVQDCEWFLARLNEKADEPEAVEVANGS